MRLTIGKPLGFVETGKDVSGLIKSWHDGLWGLTLMSRLYPMTAWVKRTPLDRYLVASPNQNYGIGVIMKFRDQIIEQRMRDVEEGKLQENDKVDFLHQ